MIDAFEARCLATDVKLTETEERDIDLTVRQAASSGLRVAWFLCRGATHQYALRRFFSEHGFGVEVVDTGLQMAPPQVKVTW